MCCLAVAASTIAGVVPWPWPLAPVLIAVLLGVAWAVLSYASAHVAGAGRPGGEEG